MQQVSERRKKPRNKTARDTHPVWVTLENVPGYSGAVRGKVVDVSDNGVGVETPSALPSDVIVMVKGEPNSTAFRSKVRARIAWCLPLGHGIYHAGLTYVEDAVADNGKTSTVEPLPDYYDVLQVSPNADPDTIHRVFRLLAQRFHPDNSDSGDPERFRAAMEAYKVLSDPEQRAAYDVNLNAYRKLRWKIFDQREAAHGKAAEKRKRRGILELLYAARVSQPFQPGMTIHELEDLLGCAREHLEFSLWFLKENALIARSDNGRYSITAKGVERMEEDEASLPTS